MTTEQDKRTAALAAIERVSTLVERETADCHSSPMCRSCEVDLENLTTIRKALATLAASCDHCGSAEGSAAHFREGDWLCALATPDARVAELEEENRKMLEALTRVAMCDDHQMACTIAEAALAPGEPKEGE